MNVKIIVNMSISLKHQEDDEDVTIELGEDDFRNLAENKLKEKFGKDLVDCYAFNMALLLR